MVVWVIFSILEDSKEGKVNRSKLETFFGNITYWAIVQTFQKVWTVCKREGKQYTEVVQANVYRGKNREQPSKEVVKSSSTYSTGSRVIGDEDGILPNCHRPSLLNYMVWILPVGSYQKLWPDLE